LKKKRNKTLDVAELSEWADRGAAMKTDPSPQQQQEKEASPARMQSDTAVNGAHSRTITKKKHHHKREHAKKLARAIDHMDKLLTKTLHKESQNEKKEKLKNIY